jgi:uncharacterized membrane protein YfcA
MAALAAWFASFFTIWLFAASSPAMIETSGRPWWLWAAMVFRSFVGAVAPLGGGAASIGLLVLKHGQNVEAARNVALGVQAVGTASAATYLLCVGARVDWAAAGWAALGFLAAAPFGLRWLDGFGVSPAGFAVHAALWAGFGLVLIWRGRWFAAVSDPRTTCPKRGLLELAAGLVGGAVLAPLAGGCAALPLYLVLVLIRRLDVRTATASCIVLMAMSSLLCVFVGPAREGLDLASLRIWVLIVPVSCIGAPLGLHMMRGSMVRPLLWLAAVVCLGHGAWVGSEVFGLLTNVQCAAALAALLAPVALALLVASAHGNQTPRWTRSTTGTSSP